MTHDQGLVAALQASAEQNEKAGKARKQTFLVWNRPDLEVTGWKFNEWDYGKTKVQLPVNARGIFTLRDAIVVRGYDKFFNINEQPSTRWDWIQTNTKGPYSMSVKENGCIVFLAGLSDGTLVVTSKHSTGPRSGEPNTKNHSFVASEWVDKHLQAVGNTRQQLAEHLYSMDVTAAGELCDDEFEEHILPYVGDRRGIYLHGLNSNTAQFSTKPMEQVKQFATEYGFLLPVWKEVDSVVALRQFLEDCAKKGSWNGVDVEGFVIRCKVTDTNRDFFFKYKFDEPYFMYREWREVTKAFLSGKPVRFKKHKAISQMYLKFITPILRNDSHAGEQYLKNRGIIALRQRFLDYCKQTGMENVVTDAINHSGNSKIVFVTVATIGCGKTTVSVALSHLTGWGHIQNDNIKGGGPRRFAAEIKQLFDQGAVAVIADRNNHKYAERQQLFDDVGHDSTDLDTSDFKFVCLNFLPTGPSSDSWDLTRSRVTARGNNHQSIRDMDDFKISMIMKGFVSRFQVVDNEKSPDSMFDLIIDLDVSKGSKYNLELILSTVRTSEVFENAIRLPEYTPAEIDDAMELALHYEPTSKKVVKDKKPQVKYQFFGIRINIEEYDIPQMVDMFFATNPDADATTWNKIKRQGQVQEEFHVTIVHKANIEPKYRALFKQLTKEANDVIKANGNSNGNDVVKTNDVVKAEDDIKGKKSMDTNDNKNAVDAVKGEDSHTAGQCKSTYDLIIPLNSYHIIKIRNIGYSEDIVALSVDLIDSDLQSCNSTAHITLGTLGIPARESLAMLESKTSTKHNWNIEPNVLDHQHLCAYS